jgi:hypothetical protein
LQKVWRGFVLALFGLASCAAFAALPSRGLPQPQLEPQLIPSGDYLRSIAGWLKQHGREGFIAADVADAMGIQRTAGQDLVAARQRGFRNDEHELRVAQVSAEEGRDFILFMVQQPDDQVYFYLSTPQGGLRKALVSIPSRNLVVPLDRSEAELRFRQEVLYWKDRSSAP